MKKLVMLVACLTSLNAFALDQSSSWSEIFAKAYSVNAMYNLGGIALSNACVTATEVKSIKPQAVCNKYHVVVVNDGEGMTHNEYICDVWGSADFVSPRTYTNRECAKFAPGEAYPECLKWEDVSYTIPNTVAVEVGADAGGEAGPRYFWKNYTFPACK